MPLILGETLPRGDVVRWLYRLGRSNATGIVTLDAGAQPEVLVLRRGYLISNEVDGNGRPALARLARLAAAPNIEARFDGGIAAHPPGGSHRQLSLVMWVRRHLEDQVDATRAQAMVQDLAGVRLSVRAEVAPDDASCDDTDRRMLAALAQPRRLDQIWSLARAPRFRMLTFLHFLRSVGALSVVGVGAEASAEGAPSTVAHPALRLLGVPANADRDTIKRAYRRLARALHPDLHPSLDDSRRRELERKLAEITAAYDSLAS